MNFKNAIVYGPDFKFAQRDFYVSQGRFTPVPSAGDEHVCLKGRYVIPGLIDVHSHGNVGADFSDGDYEGLKRMAAYYAQNGITSFNPASMTLPEEDLAQAFRNAVRLRDEEPGGMAYIQGINMEGPFFNEKKKGAQAATHLKNPDYSFFKRLYDESQGMITLVAVAPELPGALDFIQKVGVSSSCSVSLAHTNASYDEARAGIEAGARHITHTFNAMNPLLHRAPGPIAAAVEAPQVMMELICDGIHIHEGTIRAAFSMIGAARVVFVSDSMRACGLEDGEYTLGGQKVIVNGRLATLEDGTIAGSATNLYECMRVAMGMGIKKEDAIRAATYNPARAIGKDKLAGTIEPGKFADFVVADADFNIEQVYVKGKRVR